ncbi:MAG: hypothetical protein A2156_07600 [Deltaproteobacteria bacterium RBG_16_48_10]|nr:MAG: hypothetical protein A2156_07600 [Deltaproteobacteria bacterium RBG_16_48_10]
MKIRRYKWAVGAAVVLFLIHMGGCAQIPIKGTPPQYTGLSETPGPSQSPNAPIIKHAYAIDRGIHGTILKIYLEAEDPNGDMAKIATTVDQVAYGHYPTDFIILKPEYRKHFKGYIQWNTFSPNAASLPEWNYVTVKVAAIDTAGNLSNEFEFRFTFETGTRGAPMPPAPFDRGDLPRLGNVFINLYNPYLMGGGDAFHD